MDKLHNNVVLGIKKKRSAWEIKIDYREIHVEDRPEENLERLETARRGAGSAQWL